MSLYKYCIISFIISQFFCLLVSKYDDCNIGYPFHDVHVHNNSFGNLDHGQQQKDNQEEHQQMYVEGHRIREGDYDRMFAVKGRERSEVAGRRMQESINNSLAIAEGNREACDEVQNKDKEVSTMLLHVFLVNVYVFVYVDDFLQSVF